MLPDELAPDGTEERELLPCGCLYDAAMLEMWCVKKGMFVDAELKREKLDPNVDWVEHLGPKTFGKHKLLLLRFWEMMFGPFNCQTLFNLHGARVNAVWQFSELETQALAQFGPNPGYVQLEKPPRARPKRKRDAVPVNPAL
ncbi:hypothetical protein BU25DRAFT_408173 [Macroventuria anomochaeta]|uniref:Uncharacterized protein n=1 Tax=Macroventuria anomochaeta TaxID=301207 RepID=A0ACB6SC39_9PLEO|nr:uncharacterized protein BU25DRAFT_408173 [Macroventuria anomochaeta]KAF2630908.1 hypothetical protein BU25DRAFT_408173 [Macroventuria anomochaeta]